MLKSLKDLNCWKACREVRIYVMQITKGLPKDELYDLKSNIRRAARSSTRNIAEGYGRFHFQETIQFCRISRGSLLEIADDLDTAKLEGYVTEDEKLKGEELIARAVQLVNGYIRFLQKQK